MHIMFFNKNKNPYEHVHQQTHYEEEDTYPVILHFTPAAIYVYEDKEDTHIQEFAHIELCDQNDTVLIGTLVVTYVHSLQEALDKYKVHEIGLPVIFVEISYFE